MLDENLYNYITSKGKVELSKDDYKFLKLLIYNKHRVVTYDEITQELYEIPICDICLRRCIMTRASKLANKLNHELKFKNVSKVGYKVEWRGEK